MLRIIEIGEVKATNEVNSRGYYGVTFKDATNPFSKPVKRQIFQRATANGPVWDADPKDIAKLLNKEIPGAIVSKEVPAYEIATLDGEARSVTTFTTVVFGHENDLSVFKAAGHDYSLLGKEMSEAVELAEPSLI